MTTDTLARLRELAQKATPRVAEHDPFAGHREGEQDAADAEFFHRITPDMIMRLCDVVAAADAMRREFFPDGIGLHQSGCKQCDSAHAYDAARKALE